MGTEALALARAGVDADRRAASLVSADDRRPARLTGFGVHDRPRTAALLRHTAGVKGELDVEQWDAVTSGTLRGPDGRRYQRRSTRMRRRQIDDLLADGAPLVLYWYGAGQLDWHDEADAAVAWASARKRLTTSVPKPDGDVVWTAGEWLSDDRSLVLLTGTC